MSIEGTGPSLEEMGLDPEKEGLKDGSEKSPKGSSDTDKNKPQEKKPWKPDPDTIRRIQGKIESL